MTEKKSEIGSEEYEAARVAHDYQDFLDEIEREKLQNRIVCLLKEQTAARKLGDEERVSALEVEIERLHRESLERFGY